MAPRYIWRASGCPPYPRAITQQLEEALANGSVEVEVTLDGRDYVVRLQPAPFRQILKSDRTKQRGVERERAPPTAVERLQQRASSAWRGCLKDPLICCKACCATQLRRHGVLLLCVAATSWMAVSAVAIVVSGVEGETRLAPRKARSASIKQCGKSNDANTARARAPGTDEFRAMR